MTQEQLQREVIEKGAKFFKTSDNKGYLDLAMRSGKTRCSIEIMREVCPTNAYILIAYPDNKLKDVWVSELEKWGYRNKYIEFVNFSSLSKVKRKGYNFFICDEFHSLSENEVNIADDLVDNCLHNLFLSGTISKETKNKWPEFKEIYKFTTNEGILNNILADYTITVHFVELDTKVKTANKKGKLLSEKQKYDNLSFVIRMKQQKGENPMILALARNRLALSSIGKINALKKLLYQLKDKRMIVFCGISSVADNLGIPSYHSKSKDDENLQRFQRKEINHLALVEKGKAGLTYSDLDGVILLNFTYNSENSAQGISRAGLLDYTGKCSEIHILALNEPPETKKIKESLSMLDQSKIKYL